MILKIRVELLGHTKRLEIDPIATTVKRPKNESETKAPKRANPWERADHKLSKLVAVAISKL